MDTTGFQDGLLIGGGTASTIAGIVIAWIKSRSTRDAAREHADRTAIPQPLVQEQTSEQANWKANSADHTNIFSRISCLERELSELRGTVAATMGNLEKQLDRMGRQIQGLYDRIILGDSNK